MIYSFLCGFHSKGYPRSKNWTLDFEPAFSQRFSPTLSPRSFFHTRQRFPKSRVFPEPTILFSPTGQRFPLPNHVTSGCMSPQSYFPHWSVVSPSKSRDFRFQALPAHDVIDLLSTNQKPPYAPYGRSLLLS